jgi:hypothetical protein
VNEARTIDLQSHAHLGFQGQTNTTRL